MWLLSILLAKACRFSITERFEVEVIPHGAPTVKRGALTQKGKALALDPLHRLTCNSDCEKVKKERKSQLAQREKWTRACPRPTTHIIVLSRMLHNSDNDDDSAE